MGSGYVRDGASNCPIRVCRIGCHPDPKDGETLDGHPYGDLRKMDDHIFANSNKIQQPHLNMRLR